MSINKKQFKELRDFLLKMRNEKEADNALEDLFTPQELETISERLQIIRKLKSGFTQRKIAADLGVSVSKVTRGANVLKYGKGGFENFA